MQIYKKSAMQRLSETCSNLELWWDSSPLIFKNWKEKMLKSVEGKDLALLRSQLDILFDERNPADTLFSGVTTNPRLTRKVLDLIPDKINFIVDKIIKDNPTKSNYFLAWEVYKAITKKGAALYLPLFRKTNYTKGFVSAQVDPRLVEDIRKMLAQAIELKELSENIMIKCPGSMEGIYVIELLTALGIPTNATLVFCIPQVVEVAKAVKKGHQIGEENGIDYSKWRSVITIMIGRFEGTSDYIKSAESVGIELNEELLRWTGIAVGKKAHRLLNDNSNGYLSKLLLCSARPGPGKGNIYHIEKFAGGNMVYTLNPEIIADFISICKSKKIYGQVYDPIPSVIMKKLEKIPYFRQGYEIDGIKKEKFVNHPSFKYTRKEFSGSMAEIEEYVKNRKNNLI